MNPPLHATHHGKPVRIYHIENGSAYVAFSDGKTDYVAWNALRLPEATALKLSPGLESWRGLAAMFESNNVLNDWRLASTPEFGAEPAHWSEWGSRRCEITGRHIHYRSRHGGTETQKVSAVDRASTTYQWSWWRDGGSVRVTGGNGFLTPKDAMAAAEKYTLLREGEPASEPLPIAPEISPAPTPAPAVKWAEWVEVSEHRIRRPGVSQDGTEHWQSVVFIEKENWAWNWHSGGCLIHERKGFTEGEWALWDCEDYTAGKTAPVGPTPANAGEK